MLDSNRNISNNTEYLSSFSKKVYDSISDISNSNNNISSNVSEFLSYSNSMLEKTKVEGASIKNTIFKMNDILDIVQQVKDSINKSNKKSKEISLIVDLIQDIAQQTNLLSLNASIEAARAGEHGRGFAVVAQEIRVLAEKSANSTKQIYDLIKTVQDYSNEATITSEKGKESIEDTFRVIKDTSSMLDFIVTQMNYSSSKVSEISTFLDVQNNSSQSLLNNAEQMISMIVNLDQETKKQLEESSKIIEASENMNNMTKHIEKSVMEQIVANEQISNSMRIVSESSLKNLDMAVELSNMTKELDDNSKNMKEFISTFKLS